MARTARGPRGRVTYRVEGLNELITELKKVDGRMDRELAKTHKKAAHDPLVKEMRRRGPRGATGQLSRSPRASTSASGAAIYVGDNSRVVYAGPINFGWPARNIQAQEFIYSTLRDKKEEFLEVYVVMLDDLLSRAFPGGKL